MKRTLKTIFTKGNEKKSPVRLRRTDFRRKKSAVISEICGNYFQVKIIFAIFFLCVCCFSKVFAQNIYNGGNGSGNSLNCYAQAQTPGTAVYTGGNGRGDSRNCYAQTPTPGTNIYTGGCGHGHNSCAEAVSACSPPTPIELLFFTAKWKDANHDAALLDWATASEFNNEHFEIQRSTDAVNFSSIIQIPGAGNSSMLLTYSETDNDPVTNAASYYRLKQVDFNGDFSYSNIAVLNAPEGIDIINIWPNPSVNNFTFMITSTDAEGIRIEVINTNGKRVISLLQTIAEGVSIISVDTKNLISGYYLLRVMTESGNYKDQIQFVINSKK